MSEDACFRVFERVGRAVAELDYAGAEAGVAEALRLANRYMRLPLVGDVWPANG
jgi:hypothetical protein